MFPLPLQTCTPPAERPQHPQAWPRLLVTYVWSHQRSATIRIVCPVKIPKVMSVACPGKRGLGCWGSFSRIRRQRILRRIHLLFYHGQTNFVKRGRCPAMYQVHSQDANRHDFDPVTFPTFACAYLSRGYTTG